MGLFVALLCLIRSESRALVVQGVSEKIVGVLGGGQLGRMLCQAASEMAVKVAILDPSENCPASSLSHYHMVGSFDDSTTVEEFSKRLEFQKSLPHPPSLSSEVHLCIRRY